MILVDGIENGTVSALDRGLAYGDGIFRTFPMRNGRMVLWGRQHSKLASDCAALGIVCPGMDVLERDLALIAARQPECIIKLIVTRGCSARGYHIPDTASPTRIVIASPCPKYPPAYYAHGVRVMLCRQRLSMQPALAGLKHLNRLENVLARSEWNAADIAEGLLRNTYDEIVGGTMTNVFLVKQGRLATPGLDCCGVAGVTRELIMDLAQEYGISTRVERIGIGDIFDAEEVFVVNSVIGIWQVTALEERTWGIGPTVLRMRDWIARAEDA